MMPFPERRRRIAQLYFSSLLVYGIGLLICLKLPYYQKILPREVLQVLAGLYRAYAVIAPVIYIFRATPSSENKPYLFLRGLTNIIKKARFHLEPEEKTAALFLLVKIFFLPLMIKFFLNNVSVLQNIQDGVFTYPIILTLIFAVDTLVFAVGYSIEFKSLKNVVKSVEPTLLGWMVTLVCYPPFNGWIGKYVPWGSSEEVIFWGTASTVIFRIIILALLGIYLWATLALGSKASNLTNRGIITKFPYSIVRHPAYISKNLT